MPSDQENFEAAELATLTELARNQAVYAERQLHMDKKLDGVHTDINLIKTALLGDASEDKPGMMVRLTKLEVAVPENLKERLSKLEDKNALLWKIIWIITTAIVTLIVTKFMG